MRRTAGDEVLMRIRNWSIRSKIVLLVVPPLVCLLTLWIFATSVLVGPALNLLHVQTYNDDVATPGSAMVIELQKERVASLVYLGANRTNSAPLVEQRAKTQATVDKFVRLSTSQSMRDAGDDLVDSRITDAVLSVGRLAQARRDVDGGALDRTSAYALYTSIISSILPVFDAMSADPGLTRAGNVFLLLSRAEEQVSQEDALLNGIAAVGKVQAGDVARIAPVINSGRYLFDVVGTEFTGADRDEYTRLQRSDSLVELHGLEERVLNEAQVGKALPFDINAWNTASQTVFNAVRDFSLGAADRLVTATKPKATAIFVRVALTAVLGLLAFVISSLLTIRIGRSIVRRLTGLRQSAQSLADIRLPGVVTRLRHGEAVDVAAETPALEFGSDEIGAVGKAFGAVQRTAVESAVHEAQLRRGLNEVFLNIARRSQTLLHRQLSLLDRMERTAEADELQNLFRVDHLATRMRRHAEDLVILAGASPGRGWRHPVPLVDVVRGAVSEVEDYSRVKLLTMPPASLVGRAVADVIHLLAEIIENATSYSPPHTQVQVSGMLVPNGLALEVEDRGLGMSPEDLTEANARLLTPPDFDPANSAQLGLMVVSLLAARHKIKVTLRASPYGGVTAVVLVPPELIDRNPPARTLPAANPASDESRASDPSPAPKHAVRPARSAPESPAGRAARPATKAEPIVAAVVEAELTDDGLPKRRRQASIAPQLRDEPEQSTVDDTAIPVGGRSPEEARTMMSSLQAGLLRGRRDAAAAAETDEGTA
jgi:hypothetical protein